MSEVVEEPVIGLHWPEIESLEQYKEHLAAFRRSLKEGRENDPIIWEREEGERVVSALTPELNALGFDLKIIGSVATAGQSPKDLDLLLKPQSPPSVEDLLQAIAVIRQSYTIGQFHHDNADFPPLGEYENDYPIVAFLDARRRPIEIFLEGVPEEIWDAESCKAQMWSWEEEDHAVAESIRSANRAAPQCEHTSLVPPESGD